MKKILTVLTILFLCGCSSQYTLTIDGDKISEKIVFPIDKNKIHEEDELSLEMDLYSKDSIENLISNDLFVEDNSRKYVYNKEVVEEANNLIFTLTHDYEKDRLVNSRILNECFENTIIEETKEGLNIKLSGKFYCYHADSDSLDFKVVTNNVVKSVSTDSNIFKSEYVWKIDKSNRDNINIDIQVLYETKFKYYGLRLLAFVIVIGAIIGAVIGVYKLSKRAKVNEI